MVRVEILPYERFDECLAIRLEVFVEEQQVPLEEEEDGRDPDCIHFLASEAGEAVGTARLRLLEDGTGKAERVAVVASGRRGGIGRALMQALEAEARTQGAPGMQLNAQLTAIPFYEAIGYEATGPVFDDAGIPHRKMTKALVTR